LIKSVILLSFFNEVEAQKTPSVETEVDPAIDAHLFYKKNKWEHVLKYRWAPIGQENFQEFTFSSRFSFENNYKVGLYATRAFEEKHFSDWQKINGKFQWRDLDGERETHLGGFVQKKWILSDNLGSELRVHLERRITRENNFLRIRPGITWTATPLWTTYLRYEAYSLLGNDVASLYRWGVYLGALYRGFSNIVMGPFARYNRQEWWTSPAFKKEANYTYRSHEHRYSMGVSLIYFL